MLRILVFAICGQSLLTRPATGRPGRSSEGLLRGHSGTLAQRSALSPGGYGFAVVDDRFTFSLSWDLEAETGQGLLLPSAISRVSYFSMTL